MNAESSTKNFFLSFLLLFFASVAGWLLYQELNQSAIFSGKEPVGKVLYQEKGLQRRYHNDTHWEKISKETILYDQDSIRTQKGSSGIIDSIQKCEMDSSFFCKIQKLKKLVFLCFSLFFCVFK